MAKTKKKKKMKKEIEISRLGLEQSGDNVNNLIKDFSRTTEEIFSLSSFREKLSSGRQLRMKFGVDVTAPDLHIGHAVNLWMYRELQEHGHKVVFLIGDFTTQIGDPTGKSKTRPIIPEAEIKRNSEAFIKQAMMVLHNDPNLIEIRRNSEWYDKMSAKELLSLISLVTNNQLISRDMFRKRAKEGKEIYEHELIYPVLQAYDSVMLKDDLTIIGSDQLFNEMMGRLFQEKFKQTPQIVITTKITPGIDGKEKQSKSLGNYIGLNHSARDKFGRIMSMPDSQIVDYLKVYTRVPLKQIEDINNDLPNDPMKYKLFLAKEIVKRYHGNDIAKQEYDWFQKAFSKKTNPEDIPVIRITENQKDLFGLVRSCFNTGDVSNSEIRRLIQQKAIKVNHKVVSEMDTIIPISEEGITIKIGKKKWFRLARK